MTTAVGRPRAASPAKVGPESTAARPSGWISAITSGMDLRLSRSTPLAQITAGISFGQASAARWARRCWAGSATSTASASKTQPRWRR